MRAMLDDRINRSDAAPSRSVRDPHHQLRVRAAWLYYVEGLTQSDVAKKLGVNRIMITRCSPKRVRVARSSSGSNPT